MKILDILDYIKEPKTGKQLNEKFGHYSSLLNCLIKSGAARRYDGIEDNPSCIYSHIVISYYVATGIEHKSKFARSQTPVWERYLRSSRFSRHQARA